LLDEVVMKGMGRG